MQQDYAHAARITELKARIARIGHPGEGRAIATHPFGLAAIDDQLPGGGLPMGALHEVVGGGPDVETGAAAALLIAGILARRPGPVLWVQERPDLFAPALDAAGLDPDRVVYAEAGKAAAVLLTVEEGVRHTGLAGVVGELSGRLTLTASRRLQLAAEQSGVTCFLLRRSRSYDDPALKEPTAAATRWRVTALPAPPTSASRDIPDMDAPQWRLELTRCRGAEPANWIVEASDAKGRLHLATHLADRPAAAPTWRRRAPGG